MKTLLNIAMREAGTEEAEGSLDNERILQYAEEAGFDFIKTEHLCNFDGQPGYSLGQGE